MILIRADANEHIGTGHVMRCLSIANAFVQAGHEVKFITADHRGDGLIQSRGFESICLNSEWTQMEGEEIDRVLRSYRPDLLLVDSYFVTEPYLSSLSNCVTLAYIDDLNDSVWNLDFLINYNIFGTVADYSRYKETRTRLLLGPTYAPLRNEFKNIPGHEINDAKNIKDIMVSAGGADPEGITEKLIESVCDDLSDIAFHFVVGVLNPRLEKIRALANEHRNVILHINEKNMSALMKFCDVAISAAGSTLYELCACGTPTITYTLADNQLTLADEFRKQGIMLSAGDCRGNACFIPGLAEHLHDLIADKEKRGQLSVRMQSLVDGCGAERIVGIIWGQIVSDAHEVLKDSNAVNVCRDNNRRVVIGKAQNGRVMVVEYKLIDEEEIILHSSIANEEEVKIYNGAYRNESFSNGVRELHREEPYRESE